MRYVSQLRRKHTSLCAVLKLSIFETMNACNGVVERPADESWLIAGNVWSSIKFNVTCEKGLTAWLAFSFKCRHRGREHWWAGYLRLKIAVLSARADLTCVIDVLYVLCVDVLLSSLICTSLECQLLLFRSNVIGDRVFRVVAMCKSDYRRLFTALLQRVIRDAHQRLACEWYLQVSGNFYPP